MNQAWNEIQIGAVCENCNKPMAKELIKADAQRGEIYLAATCSLCHNKTKIEITMPPMKRIVNKGPQPAEIGQCPACNTPGAILIQHHQAGDIWYCASCEVKQKKGYVVVPK